MNTQEQQKRLYRFIKKGNLEEVTDAISKGASPSARNCQALTSAAASGHIDVVKLLLKHIFPSDCLKSNAIKTAAKHGHSDITKTLTQYTTNEFGAAIKTANLIHEAVRFGEEVFFNTLTQDGTLITPKHASALLGFSVFGGNLGIISTLLKCGANPNGDDHCTYSQYPIMNAIRANNIEAVKMLIEAGSQINQTGPEIWASPLCKAARDGHGDILKLLVEKGANLKLHNGCVLVVAAEEGHLELFSYLIDKGADWTFFRNAILQKGTVNCVQHLITACGASPIITDDFYQKFGKPETKEWLDKYVAANELSNKISADLPPTCSPYARSKL